MKSERISPFWVNGYQPFSASRKPWQYHCMHPLRHLYFEYQDLTPWKGENVLNNWKPRLHRFIHFLPYTLGLKRSKYLNIIDK